MEEEEKLDRKLEAQISQEIREKRPYQHRAQREAEEALARFRELRKERGRAETSDVHRQGKTYVSTEGLSTANVMILFMLAPRVI